MKEDAHSLCSRVMHVMLFLRRRALFENGFDLAEFSDWKCWWPSCMREMFLAPVENRALSCFPGTNNMTNRGLANVRNGGLALSDLVL